MLSPEFYRRFSDTDYILVCQLDAYIFRDELLSWCKKEYDYIGAPWSAPALYRMPILRLWRRYFHSRRRTEKDFKVGNGGLSIGCGDRKRIAKILILCRNCILGRSCSFTLLLYWKRSWSRCRCGSRSFRCRSFCGRHDDFCRLGCRCALASEEEQEHHQR